MLPQGISRVPNALFFLTSLIETESNTQIDSATPLFDFGTPSHRQRCQTAFRSDPRSRQAWSRLRDFETQAPFAFVDAAEDCGNKALAPFVIRSFAGKD